MRNYETESGETHKQPQLRLPASILLKNHPIILRDAIIQYPNFNLNDENPSATLMGSKYFVMIGKIQLLITHTIVYDTLLQCTVQEEWSPIQNRPGSR
jgi:hypothetical protein